jgi:hypothetical protein
MFVKISNVHVGEPLRHKALSVFPLFSETNDSVEYILSDEALRSTSVVVNEISDSGSVPELFVDNKSDKRVLFIEGEELIGAKQNRILNTSIMVAAHSELKIPVSCVEQGRWRYKQHWFSPCFAKVRAWSLFRSGNSLGKSREVACYAWNLIAHRSHVGRIRG